MILISSNVTDPHAYHLNMPNSPPPSAKKKRRPVRLERVLALLLNGFSVVGFAGEIFTAMHGTGSGTPSYDESIDIPIWHDCIGISACLATLGVHFKGAMHGYTYDGESQKTVKIEPTPREAKWLLRGDLFVFLLWCAITVIVGVGDGMELRKSLEMGDLRLLPIYTMDVVLMTCIATLFSYIGARKRLKRYLDPTAPIEDSLSDDSVEIRENRGWSPPRRLA